MLSRLIFFTQSVLSYFHFLFRCLQKFIIMDVVDAIDKLRLEVLPLAWVNNVWKNSFSEIDALPPEYEAYLDEINIVNILEEINIYIQRWLESETLQRMSRTSLDTSNDGDGVDAKSWQYLIKKEIKHKALTCLLGYLINQGKTDLSNEEARYQALSAIEVYIMLLAVPGCQVFHIFNSILFSQAIQVLEEFFGFIDLAGTKNKQSISPDDSDDTCNGSDVSLSHHDKSNLIKKLNRLLKQFIFAFPRINFRSQEESLTLIVQLLVKISRLDKTSVITQFETNASTYSALSIAAFKVLKGLCSPDVGDVPEVMCIIMKELIPVFLCDKNAIKSTAKESSVMKENVTNFLKYLLKEVEEAAAYGLKVLVQHLCLLIPDKADARVKAVSNVIEILHLVPASIYGHSVLWIYSLCHSESVKHRINGLEIISRLVVEPIVRFSEEDSPLIKYTSYAYLIAIVLSRCRDNAASVRTKALTIFSNVMASFNRNIRSVIESIFVTPYLTDDENVTKSELNKQFIDFKDFFKCLEEGEEWNQNPLPGAQVILDFLDFFLADNKVFVKKSALMCLASICCLHSRWMNDDLLRILMDNCRDKSVMIRKSLTQCLTSLLEHYPDNELVCKYWVRGILPLLFDTEQKSQEKVIEVFAAAVIGNLVPYGNENFPVALLPWKILELISQLNFRKYLRFACAHWVTLNIFNQTVINTLCTYIGTEYNANTWLLLVCITECYIVNNPQFILNYYLTHIHTNREADIYVGQMVLDCVKFSCKKLNKDTQSTLMEELKTALKSFSIPHQLILQSLNILALLSSGKEINNEDNNFALSIIEDCEQYIEEKLDKDTPVDEVDEEFLCRRIVTIGCVVLLWPTRKLVSPKTIDAITDLVNFNFGVKRKFKTGLLPAMVVVTLARLALQTDMIAKDFVPLFGRLLRRVREPQIKINTITALADLCIRYTALVEKYIPEMCVCLCDSEVKVRSTTLTLLIDLIQQDYLKLRCPVFFHLLSRLNDDDENIREVISDCFVNTFLRNNPTLIVQHFVESLFHYNAYYDHPAYCKMQMTSQERKVFSLEGAENQEKRYFIYKYMLEHVADEHRLKIFMRLCADVLDGVADGNIKLENEGVILLKDAFYILCSDEIKLRPMPTRETEAEDLGEERQEFEVALGKAVLNEALRSQAVEFIVPIIIRLKRVLQQHKLLLNELLLFTRELMKDYKNELQTILAADKELAQEVALDLQMLEEQENAANNIASQETDAIPVLTTEVVEGESITT